MALILAALAAVMMAAEDEERHAAAAIDHVSRVVGGQLGRPMGSPWRLPSRSTFGECSQGGSPLGAVYGQSFSCGRRMDLGDWPRQRRSPVMSSGRWAGARSPGSCNQVRKVKKKDGREETCVAAVMMEVYAYSFQSGVSRLTSPHLTSPHLTSPHLTSPHHAIPIRNDAFDAQSPAFSPGVHVGDICSSHGFFCVQCASLAMDRPGRDANGDWTHHVRIFSY